MELVIGVVVSLAVSWLISALRPRPKNEPNYRLPASSYGQNIPEIINKWRVTANWIEPAIEEEAIEVRDARSGKGGGGGDDTDVRGDFLGLLAFGGESGCELRQLILNGDKKINFDSTDAETLSSSNNYLHNIDFISGLPNQAPWGQLETWYGVDKAIAYRGKVLIGFDYFDLDNYGKTLPTCGVVLRSNTQYTLGQAIRRICVKAGIDNGLIDTTELDGIGIDGFPIPQGGEEYLKPLETLMAAYFFYPVETESGGISFRTLVRPEIKAIIPDVDCGCYELGDEPPESFSQEIEDITELPTQVTITYYNPDLDFEQDSVSSYPIPDLENTNNEKLDFDLLLSESHARDIANRYLYQVRNSYRRYKFILPVKYIDLLEQGDLVQFSNGDVVQLSTIEVGANYLLSCEANYYDSTAIESSTPAPPAPTQNRTEIKISDPTYNTANLDNFYLLDIPIFDSNHAEEGIYFVSSFKCTIYSSIDNVEYSQVGFLNSGTVLGDCDTTLGVISNLNLQSNNLPLVDNTNTLTVTVSGELETITDTALDLGNNLFFVGKKIGDVWEGEYIQAKICNLLSGNQYQLSELRRGLFSTEHYIDNHSAGEKIFLLKGTGARFFRLDTRQLAVDDYLYVKVLVAEWQDLSAVTVKQIQYKARCLSPYSVVDATLTRDNVGNITLSWVKRDRFNFTLGEITENYEVDILDGVNVVRTISTINTSIIYSTNDQISDFGSLQTSIDATIYKISSIVGRG